VGHGTGAGGVAADTWAARHCTWFEPIQTGQTHSNAIQTVLNKFKFLQTLTDPKSIFLCPEKFK
jgi:hypothetical protein